LTIESALGPSKEIVLKFLVPFARWKESFGLQKIGERRAGEVVQVARNIEMEPLGTEDTRLKTASVPDNLPEDSEAAASAVGRGHAVPAAVIAAIVFCQVFRSGCGIAESATGAFEN